MRALTVLATEIYTKMGNYPTLAEKREATKRHILTEVTQWRVKVLEQNGNYFFRPEEFKGDSTSPPFEVRLLKSNAVEQFHELKFGNLNAEDDQTRFKWDDKDPYRLQKALFLRRVLEQEVRSLFESGRIIGILFQPYNGDGLANDRYSYFYNMYMKLGRDEYDLEKGEFEAEGTYFITPKLK